MYTLGGLMQVMALTMLFPLIPLCWYWHTFDDGWQTVIAFIGPAILSFPNVLSSLLNVPLSVSIV